MGQFGTRRVPWGLSVIAISVTLAGLLLMGLYWQPPGAPLEAMPIESVGVLFHTGEPRLDRVLRDPSSRLNKAWRERMNQVEATARAEHLLKLAKWRYRFRMGVVLYAFGLLLLLVLFVRGKPLTGPMAGGRAVGGGQ